MSSTATEAYYGTARVVPVDVMMAVGSVIRGAWGDHGYSYGVEISGVGNRHLFRCTHSDGSEWFLEADNYGNVYESSRVDGRWIKGARV